MSDVGAHVSRNEQFAEQWSLGRRLHEVVRASAPTILDVGAHVGESHRAFRDLFPLASIWSFEPDPSSFEALRAVVEECGELGQAQRLALSDADGTARFHRHKVSHTSSLYALNPTSQDSIDLSAGDRPRDPVLLAGEVIDVDVRRLDTVCAALGIGAVDLLKIDVQGAEVDVLRGAGNLLHAVDVLMVEILFCDLYERSNTFHDVESVLQGTGLRLYCIAEISDNPMNGRTDWVTAIYTKSGLSI